MTRDTPETASTDSDRTTPDTLRERGVTTARETRTYDRETFEAVRERHERIAGLALVGVTTDAGEVLLLGDDTWSPPGREIKPGEDWAASAREGVERRTGVGVEIDRALLVETVEFRLEADETERFTAPAVHFEASLAGEYPEFRANPTLADGLHEYFDDKDLAWFDGVTDEVDPNHEDHVRLYFD